MLSESNLSEQGAQSFFDLPDGVELNLVFTCV